MDPQSPSPKVEARPPSRGVGLGIAILGTLTLLWAGRAELESRQLEREQRMAAQDAWLELSRITEGGDAALRAVQWLGAAGDAAPPEGFDIGARSDLLALRASDKELQVANTARDASAQHLRDAMQGARQRSAEAQRQLRSRRERASAEQGKSEQELTIVVAEQERYRAAIASLDELERAEHRIERSQDEVELVAAVSGCELRMQELETRKDPKLTKLRSLLLRDLPESKRREFRIAQKQKDDLENALTSNQELRDQLRDALARLTEKEARIRGLDAQRSRLKVLLKELNKKSTALQGELHVREEQVAQTRVQIRQLSTKLQQSDAVGRGLRSKLAEARAAGRFAAARHAELERELAEFERGRALLKSERDRLRDALALAEDGQLALAKERDAQAQRAKDFAKELAGLQEQHRAALQELEGLRQERDALRRAAQEARERQELERRKARENAPKSPSLETSTDSPRRRIVEGGNSNTATGLARRGEGQALPAAARLARRRGSVHASTLEGFLQERQRVLRELDAAFAELRSELQAVWLGKHERAAELRRSILHTSAELARIDGRKASEEISDRALAELADCLSGPDGLLEMSARAEDARKAKTRVGASLQESFERRLFASQSRLAAWGEQAQESSKQDRLAMAQQRESGLYAVLGLVLLLAGAVLLLVRARPILVVTNSADAAPVEATAPSVGIERAPPPRQDLPAQATAVSAPISAGLDEIDELRELAELREQLRRFDTLLDQLALGDAEGHADAAAEESLDAVSASMQDVARGIGALSNRSRQMERLTETIRGISQQTNMLSLNASVEAARAGEHGRSFAVVASEVQRLSVETDGCTREIAEVLTALQRELSASVESIARSEGQLKEARAHEEEAPPTTGAQPKLQSELMDLGRELQGALQRAAHGSEIASVSEL
jgi:hypothetical protein